MYASRSEISRAVAARLESAGTQLALEWAQAAPVQHFIVDDLLDPVWARQVANGYPDPDRMTRRSSLRERKRVGIAVDEYPVQVQDALFVFQAQEIVDVIRRITGLSTAVADPSLYASGLSVMGRGDFLNPHIDNSHDGDGRNYRVLNLLYYVSENWSANRGGSLELWDPKVRTRHVVEACFNRLVVMATHKTSWHSVNQISVDAARRCVSNYYFAPTPPGGTPYRNVTTFTGRPEEPIKRAVLAVVDGLVLNAVGRALPSLTRRTKHRRRTASPL